MVYVATPISRCQARGRAHPTHHGHRAERKEPDWERQYEAVRKFSVFTGTYPRSFLNYGDVDEAWGWYATCNGYAIEAQLGNRQTLEPLWGG